MWNASGKPIDTESFTPFRPHRVLYEFDGPKTFTILDSDRELYLAHWCDEDESIVRFLVVPFSERLVQKLEAGDLTVFDALDQPRIFVVDLGTGGVIRSINRVEWSDIPGEVLPLPGVSLRPNLPNRVIGQGRELIPTSL